MSTATPAPTVDYIYIMTGPFNSISKRVPVVRSLVSGEGAASPSIVAGHTSR